MDYETLGIGYRAQRQPDPRIAAQLHAALGRTAPLLNVGAGSGSYEPVDRAVVALEPAARMLAQRPPGSARAVRGEAECLPFANGAFATAMAVLTLHHWRDWRRGIAEMRRVAANQVVLTWDPAHPGFWLVADYFPELRDHDRRIFPPIAELEAALGNAEVQVVPIPHDCRDGFLGAYWRRPDRYLDAEVRRSISSFARIADPTPDLRRLAQHLANGEWQRRNEHLRTATELDVGYRLVVGRNAG